MASVPLVLVFETLRCMDAPALDRLDFVRSLMPRYDLAVPNHLPVDLQLVSNQLKCAEMNCVAPSCTCTQVSVPEEFLGCRRIPLAEAWAKFPHQTRGLGAFEQDKTLTEKDYFIELNSMPGIIVLPRFGPAMLKVQLHKLLPKLDYAVVSDVDVAFVTELGKAVDTLKANTGAMIAGVTDMIGLYNGAHNDVVHPSNPILAGLIVYDLKALRASNFDRFLERAARIHGLDGPVLMPEQDLLNEYAVKNPGTVIALPCSWAWLAPSGMGCDLKPDIVHGFGHRENLVAQMIDECYTGARSADEAKECLVSRGRMMGRQTPAYGYTYSPPPPSPGAVIVQLRITVCLGDCPVRLPPLLAEINRILGASLAQGVCGEGCSGRARALLQSGQTAVITVPNANASQAQILQSNIAAGNLVNFGIPANTVVVLVTPSGAPTGTPLAPIPVPLIPANPAAATSLCNNPTATRLACVNGLSSCTTLQTILLQATPRIEAFCCACQLAKARQAPPPTGFQLVSPATLAATCAALPAGTPGCGKQSKKGLLGLLGLLGLIPLFLVLLLCCLCLLRRKRRGQAMLFSVTNTGIAAPPPVPEPALCAAPSLAPVQCAP